MRSILAGVAAIIALVALAVAVPALWVQLHVSDRDGFVDLVRPLATQSATQDLVAEELTSQITATSSVLPKSLVSASTRAYTHSDLFPADFVDVISQQHDALFTDDAGDKSQPVELNLTDMVNRVVQRFGLTELRLTQPITVPLTDSPRKGLENGRYSKPAHQVEQAGFIAAGVSAIAAVVAVLVARRRGIQLAILGLCTVIVAGVLYVLTSVATHRAADEVDDLARAPKEIVMKVVDAGADNFHQLLFIVGGAGVAAAVLGALFALMNGRSRLRRY